MHITTMCSWWSWRCIAAHHFSAAPHPQVCIPLRASQASSNGYFAMVQLFADHGADLSLRDKDGRTPWRCAVANDKAETAQLLRRL